MNNRFFSGIFILIILTVHLCVSSLKAEDNNNKGRFAVGLNYPGLSLKYNLYDRISLEGKGQLSEGVTLFGLRGYYYLKNRLFFTGAEIDYVSFEGEESEGSGLAAELFAGMEYFIKRYLSFQLDIGPAVIMLEDQEYKVTDTGIEFVANLGVNLYFGGVK